MIVFDGDVRVDYSQAYVQVPDCGQPDMRMMFRGQVNGLCGAAVAGSMFLTTGLHHGQVPFVVEVFDEQPSLPGPEWDDVVEVSFCSEVPAEGFDDFDDFEPSRHSEVLLNGWGGGSSDWLFLGRSGWFRVRYCVLGFAAGRAAELRLSDDPVVDRYMLQFWPAPPAADQVVRMSGPEAAYWHKFAVSLSPPVIAEERVETEKQ